MKRENRSLKLIADFKDGYAAGWFFAVGECFRTELDIKWTKRKVNNKDWWGWTQGKAFAFCEGHILYDSPKAYQVWEKAVKEIKLKCEVIRPTSGELLKLIKNTDRSITFILSRPGTGSRGFERVGTYTMKQNAFVEFLRSGPREGPGLPQDRRLETD